MASELLPLREKALSLVRELLGENASERDVLYCETCLISMCIHPLIMQRFHVRSNAVKMPPIIDDVDAFSDHVVKFALAGIDAVRRASCQDTTSR